MRTWLQMRWFLFKRNWSNRLGAWSVRLGGYSAYHDGVPAALELDSIGNTLDKMGVPRAVDEWPLAPRQRVRWLEMRSAPPQQRVAPLRGVPVEYTVAEAAWVLGAVSAGVPLDPDFAPGTGRVAVVNIGVEDDGNWCTYRLPVQPGAGLEDWEGPVWLKFGVMTQEEFDALPEHQGY